jgi:hypothetical protein
LFGSVRAQPNTDAMIAPDRFTLGYPAIKTGVVQPRVDGLDACKHTMTEIRQQIKQAGGIDRLKDFLAKIEPLFLSEGPYVFGQRVRSFMTKFLGMGS